MRTPAWKAFLVATLVAGGCVGATKTAASARAGAGEPSADVAGKPSHDLIPRAVLFGNPERTDVRVSPDGKWISWLAPHGGVLNVWVAPAGDLAKARPVTAATKQPVLDVEWTFDGKHLLYAQDEGGDENSVRRGSVRRSRATSACARRNRERSAATLRIRGTPGAPRRAHPFGRLGSLATTRASLSARMRNV